MTNFHKNLLIIFLGVAIHFIAMRYFMETQVNRIIVLIENTYGDAK